MRRAPSSGRPAARRSLPAAAGIGLGLAFLQLAACATSGLAPERTAGGGGLRAYNRPYQVRGRWYAPAAQPDYDAVGLASWYDYPAQSRTTADGEPFDARLATAAHTTLPIPSYLDVTNLQNGRTARVRLNDRGPFVSDRIIDLSRGAAIQLGFLEQGTARVRVRYVGPAPLRGAGELVLARIANGQPAPSDPGPTGRPPPTDAEVATPPPDRSPPLLAGAALGGEPSAAGYDVQVGAFADPANAERAAARLQAAAAAPGGTVSVAAGAAAAPTIHLLDREGRRLYRVTLGPWPDLRSADGARAGAVALGYDGARVVRAD